MSQSDQNSPDPLVNTLVAGRYRVVKRLGEGGMGEVYLCMHEAIEKKMALKVLRPEYSQKADIVTRFQQEAISASRIKHPNVLEIFDFGQLESGAFYLAMEFLEGHDLADELQRMHVMAPQDGVRIALQICRALAAAHNQGVVHRDMKPENVFLQRVADGEEIVKIVDFGIAQLRTTEEAEKQQPQRRRLTKTGMIFGTPEYMSPEQAGGKKADHRVDIYATGIIMYEMFTGSVPFTGETFMAVLAAHLNDEAPPMRMLAPDLPISPELEAVVMRALAKKPEDRFQSMNAVAQAILASPEGAGAGPATRQLGDSPLSALAGAGYQPGQAVGAVTGHQFATPGPQTSAQFTPGQASPNPLDAARQSYNPATAVSPGHQGSPAPGVVPPYPGPPVQGPAQPGPPQVAPAITIGNVENHEEADRISRAHTYLEATGPARGDEKKSKLGLIIGGTLSLVALAAVAIVVVQSQGSSADPTPEPTSQVPAASASVIPTEVVSAAPTPPVEPKAPEKLTLKITTEPAGAVLKKGDFQVCPATPCDVLVDPNEALELSASKGSMKGSEKVLAQRDGQTVLIKLKAPAVQRPAQQRMCEVEVDGLKILRPCP